MFGKVIKNLFIILLVLFIGITMYGAINYFKEQNKIKKNNNNNDLSLIDNSSDNNNNDNFNDDNLNVNDNDNINNNQNNNNNYQGTDNNYDQINNNEINDDINTENNNTSDNNNNNNNIFKKIYNKTTNFLKDKKEDIVESTKEDNSKKYDTYNFDDFALLYEGDNVGSKIVDLLNKLIKNADDEFYTNTSVTIKNMGSLDGTITYSPENDEYKLKLEDVKNNIIKNDEYNVSFGYSKFKTHVNEIIIEKK